MNITNIIFDNNGVLTSSYTEKPLIKMAEYLSVSAEKLIEICNPYVIPLDTGKLTQYDFCANIIRDLGSNKSIPELSRIHLGSFDLKPDTLDVARQLSKKYKLSLLTNFGDGFWEANKKWQLDQIFDKGSIFISAELGFAKPELKIYEHTLAQINALSKDVVFIDDGIGNVDAAKKIGIHGIYFQDTQQLLGELAKLNIGFS